MDNITKIIKVESNNIKLFFYLVKKLESYSYDTIKKSILIGNIQVNNKAIKDPDFIVKSNDLIKCNKELMKKKNPELKILWKHNVDILFEDEYYIIVNKENGVNTCPGIKTNGMSVLNALLYHQLKNILASKEVFPVNRIDKFTTGIVIFAKSLMAKEKLQELFKNRKITKQYLAIVDQEPKHDVFTIELPISRSKKNINKMIIRLTKKSRNSYTEFKIYKKYENYILLLCKPKTGRTHQIRVHLQYINSPILNDFKYGGKTINDYYQQYLHSWKVTFLHPFLKTKIKVTAKIPMEFKTLLIEKEEEKEEEEDYNGDNFEY